MNSQIDSITKEFAAAVRQRLAPHVKKIILFGSRARGDYREGSDYDFVVVVDERNNTIRDQIIDLEVKIMDDRDEFVTSLVYDQNEWEYRKGFPIGLNILKDGIEV